MDPRHSPQKKRSRGHEGDDSSVPPEIVMRTMEMDTVIIANNVIINWNLVDSYEFKLIQSE